MLGKAAAVAAAAAALATATAAPLAPATAAAAVRGGEGAQRTAGLLDAAWWCFPIQAQNIHPSESDESEFCA